MSFQPVVPIGGYAGWRFLQTTLPAQTESFRAGAEISRDVTHARAALPAVTDAADLVDDRQLMKVALGAFGLQDDLPNRAFIEKILSDGTESADALSNRLADKRYRAFAAAFSLAEGTEPAASNPAFVEEIVERYQTRAFEVAVGEQNNDMRLAFAFTREIQDIAASGSTDNTKWFTVMGNPPLRSLFETALGLPTSFGSIDIDQQLEVFKERLQQFTGSDDIAQFAQRENREDFVQLFLLRSELASGPSTLTPGYGALTLLSNIQSPTSNLLGTALLS